MGEKRAGGPASSSPAEKYSGCKSRYRLRTVFDCDSFLCAGRIFDRKTGILREMWHLWCVSECGGGEKEVGNAELGGKSAFISVITFLSLVIILICVRFKRVSRGSDSKYFFIIHWMSIAIRGERRQGHSFRLLTSLQMLYLG
jgi:hypothetical protein